MFDKLFGKNHARRGGLCTIHVFYCQGLRLLSCRFLRQRFTESSELLHAHTHTHVHGLLQMESLLFWRSYSVTSPNESAWNQPWSSHPPEIFEVWCCRCWHFFAISQEKLVDGFFFFSSVYVKKMLMVEIQRGKLFSMSSFTSALVLERADSVEGRYKRIFPAGLLHTSGNS